MQRVVVDASVVAKWFLPESGSDAALALLGRIRRAEVEAFAPDLMMAEVSNTMWKRVRGGTLKAGDAIAIVETLADSPLEIASSSSLIATATEIAIEVGCTVYDALYIALAVRVDGTVSSADGKLVRTLAATRYAERVQLLS